MQFTVATLAAFIGLAMSVALPETAAAGVKESSLVQRLEHGGAQIFGRSIPCASNDPGQCCAVSLPSIPLYYFSPGGKGDG
ncbi:uncharacterized protein PG998_003180 [Apiospora kogelbergensis]|uniref:uncharacterized protein n=1 Tax=Apiospora kogelbergensis TaxID=1337665 RepID=UPI00312F277C